VYLNVLLTSISSIGTSHFTFNKMAHHHTATETPAAASMKSYQVNGQDEKAVLSTPHAHLI
jgi:hypothetical protein